MPVVLFDYHHPDGHVETKPVEYPGVETLEPGEFTNDEQGEVWVVREVRRDGNRFAARLVLTKPES